MCGACGEIQTSASLALRKAAKDVYVTVLIG
jgi:hypothetical protein